jgi:serine/threonine protein kinase
MKGGEALGRGTYGCAFYPALRCNDKRKYRDKLGKIMFNSDSYDEEADISRILEKVDPTQKYLIYPKDVQCFVDRHTVEHNDPKSVCKLTDENNSVNTHYTQNTYNKRQGHSSTGGRTNLYGQLIMKYGGKSVSKYFDDLKYQIDRKTFLKLFLNLFEGVHLLINNKLIHQDIKADNSVIADKSYLIDFGLLIRFKDFQDSFLMRNEYYLCGPEYRINRCKTYKEFKDLNLYNLKYCYYKYWERDGLSSYNLDNLKLYYDNYRNSGKELVPEKADIYSVGILLLSLYGFLIPAAKDDPTIVVKVHKLIHGMITPNPHDRISIDEIIKITKNIISTPLKVKTPIIPNKTKSPKLPERPACPSGKIRNPNTGRCIKICPLNKVRDPTTGKCIQECPEDKIRNPETGRCVKKLGKIGKALINQKI